MLLIYVLLKVNAYLCGIKFAVTLMNLEIK